MTLSELRAVLDTLPDEYDDAQVRLWEHRDFEGGFPTLNVNEAAPCIFNTASGPRRVVVLS